MDKVVYICIGTCKAEISEEPYNQGLKKCGTEGCSMRGHTFEKRLNFVLMKTKIPNMRDKITGIKWE